MKFFTISIFLLITTSSSVGWTKEYRELEVILSNDFNVSFLLLLLIVIAGSVASGMLGSTSLSSMKHRAATLSILIAGLAGGLAGFFIGELGGLLTGVTAGVLTGFLAASSAGLLAGNNTPGSVIADVFAGVFAGALAGGVIGLFVGMYGITSPITLAYIVFCISCITLEYLAVLYRRRKLQVIQLSEYNFYKPTFLSEKKPKLEEVKSRKKLSSS